MGAVLEPLQCLDRLKYLPMGVGPLALLKLVNKNYAVLFPQPFEDGTIRGFLRWSHVVGNAESFFSPTLKIGRDNTREADGKPCNQG